VSELYYLTIKEAGERLERGEVSSTELVQAVLERMDETEPHVHAYVGVMEEAARAEGSPSR
jgi:Asp-tRNA(Asn)/Glu-tRNA(Gln) amidotransferase A subunit family amidase